MKKLTLLFLCTISLLSATAQSANQPQQSPIEYFNQFQFYTNTETFNADSALFFAQELASKQSYAGLLSNLIHTSFAQAFIPYSPQNDTDADRAETRKRRALLCRKLLVRMLADTNTRLHDTVLPVFLWTEVQQHKDNVAQLTALTHEFLTELTTSPERFSNRLDRYGLMIHEIIVQKNELKPLATKLFDTIKNNLKSHQITATDSSSRSELDQRAYYRYMYAYVNYLEAQASSDEAAKERLLKNAFDYSPDLLDKNHQIAYFYDMIFVFSGNAKDSFQNDYLDYLTNNAKDKNQVLLTLRQMALGNPSFKARLKEYYEMHHASGVSFGQYWEEAIHSSGKAAPPISLSLLDKEIFSTKNLKGKWVLVDFWGTWCAPCRQEHPDMQKFYDSTVARNSDKISLLTIACRDTPEKVSAYMQEKKYSFPVAMSDNKVQDTYAVQGYPTKVLITPRGNYITVPFGSDWVTFVKEYSGL